MPDLPGTGNALAVCASFTDAILSYQKRFSTTVHVAFLLLSSNLCDVGNSAKHSYSDAGITSGWYIVVILSLVELLA